MSTPSMRKVDGGEKKRKEGGWGIITEIVATNVIASQPPVWRQTATPTTRANSKGEISLIKEICTMIVTSNM